MKKRFLYLMIIFSFMLITYPGFSANDRRGFYIDPQVLAAIPKEDSLDTAVYFGGRLGYQLTGHMALEVESGHARFDDDSGTGNISITPLLMNFKFHPLTVGTWDPYFLAGVGIVFADMDVNQDAVHDAIFSETGIDTRALGFSFSGGVDNVIAGQIGVGTLYHITKDAAGYIEIRVLFAESDATATSVSPESTISNTEEVELQTILIGGGMRVKF